MDCSVWKNNKELGLSKDEVDGGVIAKVLALRPATYCYKQMNSQKHILIIKRKVIIIIEILKIILRILIKTCS